MDEADVIDAVASLVAKSLISTTAINVSTYYRLLDTTRAYAAAKLAERGEADRIARRHAIFYSEFLEHDEIIQSMFGEHDLSGYAPHIGNVRAALGWALSDRGDVAVGVELAAWAAPLFIGLSLLEECRGWCERALAALDDASRGTRQEMILQEALALSIDVHQGPQRPGSRRNRAWTCACGSFPGPCSATAPSCRSGPLFHAAWRLPRRPGGRGTGRCHRAGCQAPGGLRLGRMAGRHCSPLSGNQTAAQLHCERGMALAVELGTTQRQLLRF